MILTTDTCKFLLMRTPDLNGHCLTAIKAQRKLKQFFAASARMTG